MKAIIWIVVILLIIGGIFFFMNDDTEDDDGVMEEDNENTSLEVPAPGSEGVDEMKVNGENTEESSELKTPTVFYTKNGFSPREITVKKGEAVRFINQSGRNMWVASAQHPTHKKYPAKSDGDCLGSSFDQCESVGAEVWSFTFDVEGEHGFHNHVQANHFGKVIVE